ncbi:hypothetical protein F4V91_00585 [Neorhizobium galegae]|uniref:Uncharacterized protein n=1 Tax=Neorhizobium galegae TaxID=399 RepID=A0A6A1TJU9_NEOGA|nr:hypothetical protein [Neorhizobium galegae]KAB1085062.1 hypothetical protein F4V91_00585 [Neorhizobium galegae]
MRRFIKYTIGAILVSACLVFALSFYGYLLWNTRLGLTDSDKAFGARLERSLLKPSDSMRVADIHPGAWSLVCIITAYESPSRVAAKVLGVSKSELKFIDSTDGLASDNLWGLAFLYPPNSVEYRQIHSSHFYAGDSTECRSQNDAALQVQDLLKTNKDMLLLIKQ